MAEADFWFLPGGRCEVQESSEETLRREMKEELDITVGIEGLLWVVENFFELDQRRFHELGVYYRMV